MNASPKSEKRLRYAIYARYSSDMQNEISLDEQEACCREAIAARGGTVIAVYRDSARSGWSLDRDGFKELQAAAQRGKFDAVMLWKFDRLARDHSHAVMIKMLLRHEYGLKLFCVQGFSEDDDDSPYTALMEQMLACWAAFYSRNLSSETKRGKKYRAVNGEFNGSIPPLGYILVTSTQATPERPAGLYIDPRAAAIVRRAFRLYMTGKYSDAAIAAWMNEWLYIQKLRHGQQPINKEMVRDMLQNRVYTGRIGYTETIYNGTLGERRATKRHCAEWFEGKHQGFISDAEFDACQVVRKNMMRYRKTESEMRTYVLHDRVYCARCIARKPHDVSDDNYGRMRPQYQKEKGYGWYRCIAHDRGYETCGQGAVRVDSIDAQVVAVLSNLRIPDGFRQRVETAVRNRVEHEAAFQRMEEIKAIVERIDFRWEQGFISKEEYVEKRSQLKAEIESLRPIDYDELMEAADLLENFQTYWRACEDVAKPDAARQQLLHKIVDRVFVHDKQILALVLHGDFAVVLGENETAPGEIVDAVAENLVSLGIHTCVSAQFGDDGVRTRDLCLDRAIC